jgi:hypothetical protein
MIKALAVVLLAAVAAGAVFFLKQTPQAAPVPLAQVQGTSFDVAAKPEAPKPVEAPKPEPVVEKKPVEPPAPAPVEVKSPAPEPKPVVAEAKPVVAEPKPVVAEAKPAPAPAPVDDKPMLITFSKLAFRYWPQTKDKGARDPFPKEIRALNGKKVIMDGFMFPIDFEKGKVRSFILSNGMFGCCFGDAPSITETIKVYRSDGKLMPYQSMARVTGILEVGEEFDGDGYVDSVYRIKAEDVGASQIEHK